MRGSLPIAVVFTALIGVTSAWSGSICGQDSALLARSFITGEELRLDSSPDGCAAISMLRSGRPVGDSDTSFETRWKTASALLNLPDEDSRRAHELYRARWALSAGRTAGPDEHATAKSARIGDKAQRMASALGAMRDDDGPPTGGAIESARPAGVVPPQAPSDERAAAISAHLNAQRLAGPRLKSIAVPGTETFNALGSGEVAPDPGMADRAAHLIDRFSGKEDRALSKTLAAVRQMAGTLSPEELQRISGLDDTGAGTAERFTAWLAAIPPSQMPSISYGILPRGRFGMTDPQSGAITLNHAIMNEPPNAQAAVLAHEMFHHWDLKVSGNFHEETSNYAGYVAPENVPALEFVPYAISRAFADHAVSDGNTPLLTDLQRIPADPDSLKSYVKAVVLQEKSK